MQAPVTQIKFRHLLTGFGNNLLDLLYPPLCPCCEVDVLSRDASGHCEPICGLCENRMEPLVEPFCSTCGQSYESGGTGDFRCANCSGRVFDFDFAIAPFLAQGALREMVHRFKFGKRLSLRVPLGRLFARVFDDPRLIGENWVLVPVPIHPKRQRHRTFNQATELARILSTERKLPVLDVLVRTKFTPAQSKLNRQQRLENLRESIAANPLFIQSLAGKDVLLVDDIFTTGSTGQACSSVLKKNGARKVVVITLARG